MTITTVATGGLLVPFARVDAFPGDVALSGKPTTVVRSCSAADLGRGPWTAGGRPVDGSAPIGFDAFASRPRTHALAPTAAAYMAEVQDSTSRGRPV